MYGLLYGWVFSGLYVSSAGRLSRAGYISALLRVFIIFTFATTIFSVYQFSPGSRQGFGEFGDRAFGRVAATLIVAWPLWSIFRRRMNDTRADIRTKASNWLIGFPIVLAILLLISGLQSFGIDTLIDSEQLSQLHMVIFGSLIVAAFLPARDDIAELKALQEQPQRIQKENSWIAQDQPNPVFQSKPRTEPRAQTRQAPVPVNPPLGAQVLQRQYKMPEQGRVKPGWFS